MTTKDQTDPICWKSKKSPTKCVYQQGAKKHLLAQWQRIESICPWGEPKNLAEDTQDIDNIWFLPGRFESVDCLPPNKVLYKGKNYRPSSLHNLWARECVCFVAVSSALAFSSVRIKLLRIFNTGNFCQALNCCNSAVECFVFACEVRCSVRFIHCSRFVFATFTVSRFIRQRLIVKTCASVF